MALKRFAVLCVTLGLAAPAGAMFLRYTVVDIGNPENAEYNELAIRENFEDIYRFKQDVAGLPMPSLPQYPIAGLNEPENGPVLTAALLSNIDDLWRFKVDFSTPASQRTVTLENMLDPENSEENTAAVNQLFAELVSAKLDR